MPYSARKPYLRLKKSIVELFKEPIRHLKEIVLKESQFEKPYLDSEYPTMHLDLPFPDWPTIKGEGEGGGEGGNDCEAKGCGIVGFGSHPDHCGEEPWWIDIHPGIYCTFYPGLDSDCELEVTTLAGEILEMFPGFYGWNTSRYILVNPNIENHVILATFTDGVGHKCSTIVEQYCTPCNCNNPPEGAFAFDNDSTPDTIAKGGSIDVYVTGGCPPFTWSVSGGDSSFGEETTTARVNTLTHDNSN